MNKNNDWKVLAKRLIDENELSSNEIIAQILPYMPNIKGESVNRAFFRFKSSCLKGKSVSNNKSDADNTKDSNKSDANAPPHDHKVWDEKSDTAFYSYNGRQKINNLEEALAFSKVDLNIWEVERHVFNAWETAMKQDDGTPIQVTNIQVKIWFKKKGVSFDTLKFDLIEQITSISPVVKKSSHYSSRGILLEIDIFDPHFGKLAWGKETGEDYDLAIAEQRYMDAVYDLLEKAKGYNIEKILYPIGNDFFHYDTIGITTTAGTRQDTDIRWQRMFRKGVDVALKTAQILAQVSPVDIIHVPSNHDTQTGFYLSEVVRGYFHNNENIHVDDGIKTRKYYTFGKCGIGFTHGNEEKHTELPLIMLRENQKDWAHIEFMEWHLGHWHKNKQIKFLSFDEINGIGIRILRSLSSADAWHYAKGYVKGLKGAEAIIWDAEYGCIGNLNSVIL